jgi:hypothetical protein
MANFKNNEMIVFILIVFVIVFIISNTCSFENFLEKLTNVDNQPKPRYPDPAPKIDLNKCSRQCCAQTQYLPQQLQVYDMTKEEAANYIPNNLSCNFGNGSGCLCMTKNNFNYLSSRGNNTNNKTCS